MLGGNVGLSGAGRPEEDEVRGFGFHKFIRGGRILGGEEQGAYGLREGFVVEQFDRVLLEFGKFSGIDGLVAPLNDTPVLTGGAGEVELRGGGDFADAATTFDLPASEIEAAASYYADFAPEIDSDIAWAETVAEEERQRWEREQSAFT